MDMLPVDKTNATEVLRVGSELATVLATTQETNGDLFAVELRMPPGGGPPVMHRHAPSEIYRVMSGEFTFYITGSDGITTRRVAGAGETVEVTFKVPAAAGDYTYLCSFPGHFQAGMKGTLTVK